MEGKAEEFSVGEFADRRLKKVGALLHERMVAQQRVCLRRLGEGRAGEVRFGRFMSNERVTVEELVEGVCRGTGQRCAGRHVLVIEDSSEINYQAHARRVSGLGTVGNGHDAGLFMHPALVVDAQEGACLGLGHLYLWRRLQARVNDYRKLPIEDKESLRWIEVAQAAGQRLGQAQSVTIVADREADIYEMWTRLPDERTHLLIRACRDRAINTGKGQSLFAWLSALPVRGSYKLNLPAVPGKRSAHTALMWVRFNEVNIRRPRRGVRRGEAAPSRMWAIEVVEDAGTVVDKEAPIHWRLLTTHPVETLEMACQCIRWYCQRWHIEQLFRTLKRQGLDIESSLMESAAGLEKLAVLATSAAVKTLQLTLAREGHGARGAGDAFTGAEIDLLHHVQPTLEGATPKQKNPHPSDSLAWAAWIIARLGGWKGYASERKPGPITMPHGLQAFAGILQGWQLARGEKDVCIQ